MLHTRQHLHIVSILRGVAFANSLPNLRLLIRPWQDIPPQNSIENIFKKPNNSPLQNDRAGFFVFLKKICQSLEFQLFGYRRISVCPSKMPARFLLLGSSLLSVPFARRLQLLPFSSGLFLFEHIRSASDRGCYFLQFGLTFFKTVLGFTP